VTQAPAGEHAGPWRDGSSILGYDSVPENARTVALARTWLDEPAPSA